MMPFLKEAKL